jgi:AcrR family transcriptional regulator
MTSSSASPESERPLRSDALRNRIRILTAAEAVFASRGLDAPCDEVARRAGVSIGTLYRHFATKTALLDAMFAGRTHRLADRAGRLARESDPGQAFFDFFTDVIGGDPEDTTPTGLDVEAAMAARDQPLHSALDRLLKRAQRAGRVRPDIGAADLIPVLVLAARAIRHAGAGSRALAIVVDGLRPKAHGTRRLR